MPRKTRDEEQRVIDEALKILARRARRPGQFLQDHEQPATLFHLSLGQELRENFEVLFLDSRHRLLAHERLYSGTIDGCEVHPRGVLQRSLQLNAASLIVGHNHPSGDCTPSTADRMLTTRLRDSLALVDIRLLDHIVVGWQPAAAEGDDLKPKYASMAQIGWI